MINKKIFIILFFVIAALNLFSANDSTSDKNKKPEFNNDEEWLNYYVNIDPTDDLFQGFRFKNYKISRSYVENLVWNQDIDFYIEQLDAYNLKKNINVLPRFPLVIMPFGGFSQNRGIDFGFLFRNDNIAGSRLAFTTGNLFVQNGRFWTFFNLEYPAFLDNRLKVFGTAAYFTTYPQFVSRLLTMPSVLGGSNALVSLFNKIWSKLDLPFYNRSEFGMDLVGGFDYRIPLVDLNTITSFEFMYRYDSYEISNYHRRTYDMTDLSSWEIANAQTPVNKSNVGVNIREELRWNKQTQTSTLITGNYLSYYANLYLPTTVGEPNGQIRLKNRVEEKFTKKLFREFSARFRLIGALNYNISDDFSGDPYVRGFAHQELTGWAACLANLELYVPIVNVDMKSAVSLDFARDAKFLIYWVLFFDGGFTVENYGFLLDNAIDRIKREDIKNYSYTGPMKGTIGQFLLKNDNYLLPALSVGTGIRVYPYFLPFIIRLDVGVNLLKTIVYKNAEGVEIIVSFNEMF